MKYFSKFAVASIIGASTLGASYAAVPAWGYAPGATLEPDCMPGETDCFVAATKTTRLSDADGDTYIEVENTANENYLRFYANWEKTFLVSKNNATFEDAVISKGTLSSNRTLGPGTNGIVWSLYLEGTKTDAAIKKKRWSLFNFNEHAAAKYNGLAFYEYADTNNDGAYRNSTAGTEQWARMFIESTTGNVWFWTLKPTQKLDVYGSGRIQGNLNTEGRIINNTANPNYDVWLQWGALTDTGEARNLALLGYTKDANDVLIVNYGSEYQDGTRIDGKLRTDEICNRAGGNCKPIADILSGSIGATGPAGPKWNTGAAGPKGDAGPKWNTGAQGIQWPVGPAGSAVWCTVVAKTNNDGQYKWSKAICPTGQTATTGGSRCSWSASEGYGVTVYSEPLVVSWAFIGWKADCAPVNDGSGSPSSTAYVVCCTG